MRTRVTLQEVADTAHVSPSTVSRVLRGDQRCAARQTADRIRQAAERLDYRPHLAARLLASAQSHMIAVTTRGTAGIVLERISAVSTELQECGYQPVPVADTLPPASVPPFNGTLDTSIVQGIVITVRPSDHLDAHLQQLVSAGAPVVSLLKIPTAGVPVSAVDRKAGAYMATRYLMSLGHTRIAGVNISPERSEEKCAGYRQALEEQGLEPLCMPYTGSYDGAAFKVGYELTQRLLQMPERPTAALCSNDEVAIGLIRAMYEHALRVPQDLSVVGFDGFELARYCVPALTTVRQPVQACARRVVQWLLDMIRGSSPGPLLEVLAPELVVGGSATELDPKESRR